VHQSWRREQGGRVFNLVVRLATGMPFWDTQCGSSISHERCRPLIEAATIDRFGFDVELLFLAFRAGLNLKEIPVRWDHNEGSKITLFTTAFKMVNEVGLDPAAGAPRRLRRRHPRRARPQESITYNQIHDARLNVNIDHVATVARRVARLSRASSPPRWRVSRRSRRHHGSPAWRPPAHSGSRRRTAAQISHDLSELEMAATEEMLGIALDAKPDASRSSLKTQRDHD
jgi:hypothetical protein